MHFFIGTSFVLLLSESLQGKGRVVAFSLPQSIPRMTENEKLHLPNLYSFLYPVLDILVHQEEHDGTNFTVLLTS